MIRSGGHGVLFVLTLLVVAISYLPILPASFVADDYVVYSPEFLANPLKYFTRQLWPDIPTSTYLRPLPALTFAFDNLVRGDGTIVPHLTTLLLHLAVTAAVGVVIVLPGVPPSPPGGRRFGAIAGMLLFGLHPQATGAVAWASARFDPMAGLFGTLGLYSWIRLAGTSKAPTRWRCAALSCFAAALLCKETSAVFLVGAFFWSLGRSLRRQAEPPTRLDWVSPTLLVALAVAYLAWRDMTLGQVGTSHPMLAFRWQSGMGHALVLIWPFAGAGTLPWPLLYAAVALACGGLIAWTVPRPKRQAATLTVPWGLPLTVLLLDLAAVSLLPAEMRRTLEGEESRLSYFELLALSILVGWFLQRVPASRLRGRACAAFIFMVLAAFVWPQQHRISCWKAAGRRVDSFLSQTAHLVPNPVENSTLVFKGLPLTMRSLAHAYFFGQGLQEAIAHRYNRSDLTVNRWPTPEIMEHPPASAYVFVFDYREDKLALVHQPER